MATRIVPIVYPPLPTFSARKKEDVVEFMEAVDCFFQLEKGLYDEKFVPIARKSLLVECCRGKATLFIKHLPPDKKDTWEHLTAELTEKYASNTTADWDRAFRKAMKLRQKSYEELKSYAKRAKKLAKKVDPTVEYAVTTKFVLGIRDKNICRIVEASSLGKADFTFNEVYQAVKAVARASRKYDSESASDSDTSSDSSEDGIGARKHHHHHARKEKESKVTETEVKTTKPAPDQFNMDDLAKLIEEAPQAPFIESYAVSELAEEKEKAVENEEKEKAVENEEKEKAVENEEKEKAVENEEKEKAVENEEKEKAVENEDKKKDDMRMQEDDHEEKEKKGVGGQRVQEPVVQRMESTTIHKPEKDNDREEISRKELVARQAVRVKEKEGLGVRGTVMHGVHGSALFYSMVFTAWFCSMVLLQFIVEWGHSMIVVWGILKSSCWQTRVQGVG
jgi:hypothetical protein